MTGMKSHAGIMKKFCHSKDNICHLRHSIGLRFSYRISIIWDFDFPSLTISGVLVISSLFQEDA